MDRWLDYLRSRKLKQGDGRDSRSGTEATVEENATKSLRRPSAHRRFPEKATEDPTMRLGRLAAANRSPLCVAPDDPVIRAITLMLQHDYSQLPVTTTEARVEGIVLAGSRSGSRLCARQEVR